MAKNKRKNNKFSITPSLIFLNLVIILIVCTVIFFTYNVISGEYDTSSEEAPFTPVTTSEQSTPESETGENKESYAPSDTSSSAASDTESSDISGESTDIGSDSSDDISSDASDVTESSEDSETTSAPSTYYDPEFFDDALFVGDSISTGLHLYGFLDKENVFAQQGLAPSTALSAEVDGITLEQKIISFKPKRIYIMLGTNSVGYGDTDYLVSCMKTLVDSISELCNSEIYVITIPPVTKDAEQSYDNYLTLEAINAYNSGVKAAISGTRAKYMDLYSVLTDSEGYFSEDYAEADGIHFMGVTYQVMLSFLASNS